MYIQTHIYNAKSGVSIIIGRHTHKLLHVGVRNKYCSVCSQAAKKTTPKYNSTDTKKKKLGHSSSSMISDIIVGG